MTMDVKLSGTEKSPIKTTTGSVNLLILSSLRQFNYPLIKKKNANFIMFKA